MKKLLALVLAVLMVLSLAACGNGEKSGSKDSNKNSDKNTYETPMDLLVATSNEKDASKLWERRVTNTNGLCEEESFAAWEIIRKSAEYDRILARYQSDIDNSVDMYGSDYKCSYKIKEKEKLDKDDLEEANDELKEFVLDVKDEVLDNFEGFDAYNWEVLAGNMGLTVPEVKELANIAEKIYKTLKNAEVEDGYELTVNFTVKGRELNEPEEFEQTFYVYKIDGRWVSYMAIDILEDILYFAR